MAVFKKERSSVERASSGRKIFSWERYFRGAACGILYLSIQLFCNTLEFIKKERIF